MNDNFTNSSYSVFSSRFQSAIRVVYKIEADKFIGAITSRVDFKSPTDPQTPYFVEKEMTVDKSTPAPGDCQSEIIYLKVSWNPVYMVFLDFFHIIYAIATHWWCNFFKEVVGPVLNICKLSFEFWSWIAYFMDLTQECIVSVF